MASSEEIMQQIFPTCSYRKAVLGTITLSGKSFLEFLYLVGQTVLSGRLWFKANYANLFFIYAPCSHNS